MMAFNPAVAFNPLLTPNTTVKSENPSPSAAPTTTTTPTAGGAPAAPGLTPSDPLRFLTAGNPLLQQFQLPPQAMMMQALAAQAAQAQASGLGFPVVFPPGMGADFKHEMLLQHGGPMPVLMDNAHFYHPYSLEGMKKRNATKEATEPLKAWLRAHQKNPYPTKGDKVLLAMQTRMTLTQVSTWFANARRRLKKENKMTWSPQNRRGDCDDDDFDNDDDDLNRPSSSTSIVSSDRKDDVIFKLGASGKQASPTPSGGSSDDLLTPKKAKNIWCIADMASEDSSSVKKDSPPSSDESTVSNLLREAQQLQKPIQENFMEMVRRNPYIMQMMNPAMANMMFNPMFMAQMSMQQQQQQAQRAAAAANSAAANLSQPQGLQSEESGTTPTSEASPAQSPKAPTISPAPRTATPAY